MNAVAEYRWDWRYIGAAAFLGLPWFLLVELSSLEPEGASWHVIPEDVVTMIAFVFTSSFIGFLFRPWIRRTRRFGMLFAGTCLMLAGALCCSSLIAVGDSLLELLRGGLRDLTLAQSLFMFPLAIYTWANLGVGFATEAYYLTIPMGIGSVVLLRWVDRMSSRHIGTATMSTGTL